MSAQTALAGECDTRQVDRRVEVAAVIDGDTLRLSDGRRLRLAGIDAPELGDRRLPPQPEAVAARDALKERLPPGSALLLRFDREREDRYQRLLAHAFSEDGDNLQAWLLRRGLAHQMVTPPNLLYLDCYTDAEATARAQPTGIWTLPGYQIIPVEKLSAPAGSYRLVSGRVTAVRSSRHQVRLTLGQRLTLIIKRQHLPYFEDLGLGGMKNRDVVARGRLFPFGDGLAMRLRHPVQLQVVR